MFCTFLVDTAVLLDSPVACLNGAEERRVLLQPAKIRDFSTATSTGVGEKASLTEIMKWSKATDTTDPRSTSNQWGAMRIMCAATL